MGPKSLLTLTAEITALEQAIMANNGELTPEIEQMLDLASGDFADKIDKYKYVMDAFDWRAAQFKSMKDQAAAAQKTFEALKERLKSNLKFVSSKLNDDTLVGNEWRFKVSPLKPKVVIGDNSLVPQELCNQKVEWVPDKEKIAAALIEGQIVPGTVLEDVKSIRAYVNNSPKLIKG